MTEVTRRRFLTGAGTLAGGLGLTMLPGSLQRALAAPAPELRSLEQIEHVVLLMLENRSFDHYYGTLSGVRGFDDPQAITLPGGGSVFDQPAPGSPGGYEPPFHLDTTTTSAAALTDLSHAWQVQHAAWNGGAMDNWVPAHQASNGRNGFLTMGYFTRRDLPFHYALADAFTIFDAYHCSVMGPTWPNRLYWLTGTIDPAGTGGGPIIRNAQPRPWTWTTFPERLTAAGVSWRVYTDSATSLLWRFSQYQQAQPGSPLHDSISVSADVAATFADDVAGGRLPQVSWLFVPGANSEHPPGLPSLGATFIYRILDALGSAPGVWARTVFLLNYDENDGLFDHVPPPTAPAGTAGEYLTVNPLPPEASGIAGPIGLGFRVPLLVISPWTAGGWVCSEVSDHTSTLRFLETRFGVHEPNITAWRRSVCGDLTAALRMRARSTPPPRLSDPAPQVLLEQQEVSTLPAPAPPATAVTAHQEPPGARLVTLRTAASTGLIQPGSQAVVSARLSSGLPGPAGDAGQAAGGGSPLLRPRPPAPALVSDAILSLSVPAGWQAEALTATSFREIAPGHHADAAWRVSAPAQPGAAAAGGLVTVSASYRLGGDRTGAAPAGIVSVVPIAPAAPSAQA